MGAVGSAITTPLFFYVPQMFIGDFTVACAMGALYGMTLGGFVPLSALMPCWCRTIAPPPFRC
jgi:hypothetical protein